jgi:hypothetical protein
MHTPACCIRRFRKVSTNYFGRQTEERALPEQAGRLPRPSVASSRAASSPGRLPAAPDHDHLKSAPTAPFSALQACSFVSPRRQPFSRSCRSSRPAPLTGQSSTSLQRPSTRRSSRTMCVGFPRPQAFPSPMTSLMTICCSLHTPENVNGRLLRPVVSSSGRRERRLGCRRLALTLLPDPSASPACSPAQVRTLQEPRARVPEGGRLACANRTLLRGRLRRGATATVKWTHRAG